MAVVSGGGGGRQTFGVWTRTGRPIGAAATDTAAEEEEEDGTESEVPNAACLSDVSSLSSTMGREICKFKTGSL